MIFMFTALAALLGAAFSPTGDIVKVSLTFGLFMGWLEKKQREKLQTFNKQGRNPDEETQEKAFFKTKTWIPVVLTEDDLPKEQHFAVGEYILDAKEWALLYAGLQAARMRMGLGKEAEFEALAEKYGLDLSAISDMREVVVNIPWLKEVSEERRKDPEIKEALEQQKEEAA